MRGRVGRFPLYKDIFIRFNSSAARPDGRSVDALELGHAGLRKCTAVETMTKTSASATARSRSSCRRQPDAGVYFIGRIRTPWKQRKDCPKNARESDAVCTVELDAALGAGAQGRRDLLASGAALLDGQSAAQSGAAGAGALRRPARHLRAALAGAAQPDRHERGEATAGRRQQLAVGGLDCLDGTPLLDIKPYFASTDSVPDAVVGWHSARRIAPRA